MGDFIIFKKSIQNLFKTKYPVVRQYDQIDCGPAALLSVLKYFGGNTNLVHMRELCETDALGASMLGLVKAAEKIGFRAIGASGEYEDLMNEDMPCVAHVVLENNLQHFIVIYQINSEKVLVGDPGKGRYYLTKKEFLEIWESKSVILFTQDKEILNAQVSHWLSWIFHYLKKQESWIYQSIFLGVLYTVFGLATAIFVQWLIDRFIPEKNIEKIIYTGIFLLLLLVLRAIVGYLRVRFLVILNKRVSLNITGDFFHHLFRLPKRFFDTRKTGDITARINDSLKIHQAILLFTNSTLIDGLIIIGSLCFMFFLSPFIATISLCALPIYGFILFSRTKTLKAQQREVMKNHALVESTYINSIQGFNEILSFNLAGTFTEMNMLFFRGFQDRIEKLGFTQNHLSFAAELSAALLTVSILTIGSLRVINGNILLGQLMASYSLLATILPSIMNLVAAYISLQGAHIAANRLMDLLLVEKEKNPSKMPFVLKEKLTIQNGAFAYPRGKPLFAGLNLTLEKGKLTSLWGPSGIGKSTLVQLIERKYALGEGQILLDNTPVNNFDLLDYRKNIGVVPQEIKIFNGTVMENILLGRDGLDPDQIIKKMNLLGLNGFIELFDNGAMTLLGEEGRKLSGGEKQLLALSRALFDQPDILIIDEGFSSIDINIESLIFQTIKDYAKTHIVFLISHDLDKILRTEYVYLLDKDGILEDGHPLHLLQNKQGYLTGLFNKWKSGNPVLSEVGV